MKPKKISLAYKISFLVMAISFVGISVLAYLSYNQAKSIFTEHSSQILSKNLEKYELEVKNSIRAMVKNVELLTHNPSVIGFFRAYRNRYYYDELNNKTLNQYEEDISSLFTLLLKQDPAIFQIRVLGAKGDELVKFVRKKGVIDKVEPEFLQNKGHRDYFRETMKLEEDDIYISAIDLNKEFKTIEFPIRPTIRVAKPVFLEGDKVGVIIINANVGKLFEFEKLRRSVDEITYIANEEGFYILNQKDPSQEFGFEFGFDYRMTSDFPQTKPLFENIPGVETVSFVDKDRGLIFEARKVEISDDRFVVALREATTKVFQKQSENYVKTLAGYIVAITVVITFLTVLAVRKLTVPITKLTRVAKEIAEHKGRKVVAIDIDTEDEIGELAQAFDSMLQTLIKSQRELEQFAGRLEREVEEKTKQLRELNENLQREVERQIRELREKDQALAQQAKLAAMGEMIGAIAHQWRQPINYLALNLQLLQELAEDQTLSKEQLKEITEKMLETINFMSNTIDDFRSFFRQDKEAVVFDVSEAVEKTIELLKPQLEHRGIEIELSLIPVKVKGFRNEFRQVILNLISNARDAVFQRMEKEGIRGKIWVSVEREDRFAVIRVRDNGGGIPESIKDRLFEPFFTTKEEGKGTGMGLYMSRQIIERMGGELTYRNWREGAEFIIKLKELRT